MAYGPQAGHEIADNLAGQPAADDTISSRRSAPGCAGAVAGVVRWFDGDEGAPWMLPRYRAAVASASPNIEMAGYRQACIFWWLKAWTIGRLRSYDSVAKSRAGPAPVA